MYQKLPPLLLVILLCTWLTPMAQSGWQITPAGTVDRYDDIYFINADTGWAIAPYQDFTGNLGRILRTTDSGQSWEVQLDSSGLPFRSMGFFDAQTGFIGVLETGLTSADSAVMIRTDDGGQTWSPVTNLPGPRPAGGCGIFIAGDSTLYAVGRFYGPSLIYKTTDRGNSWEYWSLDSLAGGLVDAYFWTPDSGIVIGSTGPFLDSAGVILRTYDGGQTWARLYVTQEDERMLWKISFPSPQIGYISIQQFGNQTPQKFLKTTDGGFTWQELPYRTNVYNAQAIGFVNDSVGWIGGNFNGALNFVTTDGGMSWSNDIWGGRVNRIRIVNDSVIFASGREVYRWDGFPLVNLDPKIDLWNWALHALYPNPVDQSTWITVDIPESAAIQVGIFDLQGRMLRQGKGTSFPAGRHQIELLTGDLPDGVYLVRVKMGEVIRTNRLKVQH